MTANVLEQSSSGVVLETRSMIYQIPRTPLLLCMIFGGLIFYLRRGQRPQPELASETFVSRKESLLGGELSSTDDERDILCLETGRTAHSFTALIPQTERGLFLAQHRLEGKQYFIRNLPLHVHDMNELRALPIFQALSSSIALAHPSLARYISFWGEKCYFGIQIVIQEEHVQGLSLSAFLQGSKLTEADVLHIFIRVLDGLCFLHSNGLFHGALNGSNVIIAEEVKLIHYALRSGREALVADVRGLGLLLFEMIGNAYSVAQEVSNALQEAPEMALASQMIWCDVVSPCPLEDIKRSPHFMAWKKRVFSGL